VTLSGNIFETPTNTPGVLSIDPGTSESGYVVLSGHGNPLDAGKIKNEDMLSFIYDSNLIDTDSHVVIEMIQSYGMPIGKTTMYTLVWIGRFYEAYVKRFDKHPNLMGRQAVKLHICHSNKATDTNIRAALIDRFGGSQRAAVGIRAAPGPLYGFSGDKWAALALAITYRETNLVAPF